MDNRAVATDCYKQALHCDVYSYQAFEALVQNQMLTSSEGIQIHLHNIEVKTNNLITYYFIRKRTFGIPSI